MLRRGTCTATVIVIAGLAVALTIAAGFFTMGLPDFSGQLGEAQFVPALRISASEPDLIARLNLWHADWHYGPSFEEGESAGSFDQPLHKCTAETCKSVVQVLFATWFGACFESADVVSMRFDIHQRLASWRRYNAMDGC